MRSERRHSSCAPSYSGPCDEPWFSVWSPTNSRITDTQVRHITLHGQPGLPLANNFSAEPIHDGAEVRLLIERARRRKPSSTIPRTWYRPLVHRRHVVGEGRDEGRRPPRGPARTTLPAHRGGWHCLSHLGSGLIGGGDPHLADDRNRVATTGPRARHRPFRLRDREEDPRWRHRRGRRSSLRCCLALRPGCSAYPVSAKIS